MRRCLARLYYFISKGNRFRKIRTERHPDRGNVPIFGLPIFQAGVLFPEPPYPRDSIRKVVRIRDHDGIEKRMIALRRCHARLYYFI